MITLNHKINIDMFEFIRSGRFDYLKTGMTKEEVLQTIPEPEGWTESRKKNSMMKSDCWRYGTIDLLFADNKLKHIFTDYITGLDGGEYFTILPWILNGKKAPDLMTIMGIFIKEKIAFTIDYKKGLDYLLSLTVLESKVELLFSCEHKQAAYELAAITGN